MKGTPPFGTFGGGPDVINLANLNSHLTVPVFHKPGRGLAFDFTLVYDSWIWAPAGPGANQSWQPDTNWGWGTGGSDIGRMTFTVTTTDCFVSGKPVGHFTSWSNWVYHDGSGTSHPFYSTALGQTTECSGGPQTGGFSEKANDGSGYEIIVTGDCCADKIDSAQIISPDGSQINPFGSPTMAGSVPGSIQDTNGNEITADTSGHLTDTLGAITMTTSGTSPNPVTYTYPAPNGTSATVTVTYKPYTVQTNFGCSGIAEYPPTSNSLVDKITLPNSTFYQFTYELTPGSAPNVTGRLASVALPTGGKISYVYSGGNNGIECIDGTTAGLARTTPDGAWTYSRVLGTFPASATTITDPLGNQAVMQFVQIYQTVSQVYQGPATTGSLLETVSTCYDGITTNCATTGFGLPFSQRVVTIQSGNGQQRKNSYFYDTTSSLLTEEDDYSLGQGAPGPLLKKTLYAYGPWLDGTNTKLQTLTIQDGSGAQVAQTTYNYDETTPVATSGLPQHVTVFSSNSRRNLTSKSRWLNTTGGQITTHMTYFDTGMPNIATDANNHSTTNSYSSTYAGAYPTSVRNALGQVTASAYDSNTGLRTSITDANNATTSYAYDNLGRLSQVNYPDGGQTTNCYSDIGGPTCAQSGLPLQVVATKTISSTAGSVKTTTVLDGLGRGVQTQLNSDPDGATFVDTTYDALGRVYCVSNPYRSTSDTTYGVTTNVYDSLGRVTAVQPPDYWSNTSAASPTCQNVTPSTTPANPSNFIATSYSGNATTVTDQAGKARKSVTDGLGRLAQVFEDSGASPHLNYETDYFYDALGNLLSVNQKGNDPNSADWRHRSFTYDSLSRLLTATNPESGAISYSYDVNGNLLTKTSPKPNQTGAATVVATYTYDSLNRLTQKSFNDGSTPAVNYIYDGGAAPTGCTLPTLTITNPTGRRTGMCDAAGSEAWSFDVMGRVAADARTTHGLTNIFSYTYNLDGSPLTAVHPINALTINFVQGGAGRLLSETSGDANYSYSAHYAPNGALCYMLSAWGQTFTHIYTFNNRFQPTRMQAYGTGHGASNPLCSASTDTAGSSLDLSYSFTDASGHNNGNVQTIGNNIDIHRTQSFSYDSLNSLSSAWTVATDQPLFNGDTSYLQLCWAENYGYDPWGNLLSLGPSGSSSYTGCTQESGFNFSAPGLINTNNQIATSGYSYDAAGNMTTSPGAGTVTFNAENQLVCAGGMAYLYDGDGKRVAKITGCSNTTPSKIYWYGASSDPVIETDGSGTFQYRYLFFNGMRVDREEANDWVDHYVLDHLGNVRAMYGTNGAWDVSDFYPFGGERVVIANSNNRYKFTGKERDSESGLDNFEARYDSSSLGRFMSADPLGGHLENPQSLNKYAYALNNPINLTDPTGLDSYLTCQNVSSTCREQIVGYDKDGNAQKTLVQGVTDKDGNFTATLIGNDKDDNLVDKTTGTGTYTASVNGSGVQFSNDGGKTSSIGVFVNGTPETTFQDAGFANGNALTSFTFTLTNSKLEANQTAAGYFGFAGSPDQAAAALQKAGFVPTFGENTGIREFRTPGTTLTGSNSAHLNLIPRVLIDPGSTLPAAGGTVHFGEHFPYNPIGLLLHCVSDQAGPCAP
jgi:RHS repeat-associated protein